ncbi:MAG: hypothetical protein IKU40_10700 [Clostridia bacterium]|nr:hypothetical protein [Clostridia bacterium]
MSDTTGLNWWIPYEIGVANGLGKDIAALKLRGTEDIPTLLKTELVLQNIQEFFEYTKSLEPYGGILSNRVYTPEDKGIIRNTRITLIQCVYGIEDFCCEFRYIELILK